jgi:hypothetical protein
MFECCLSHLLAVMYGNSSAITADAFLGRCDRYRGFTVCRDVALEILGVRAGALWRL